MSNLATTSKFDVLRGWPNGSAVDECYALDSGVAASAAKEGLFLTFHATNGTLILPTAAGTQGDTSAVVFRLVIQGNDQYDAIFARKVVTLRGAFMIATDKFVAAAFNPGDPLCVSVAVDADQGKLKARAGTEQIVGVVESYDSTNGILVVSCNL